MLMSSDLLGIACIWVWDGVLRFLEAHVRRRQCVHAPVVEPAIEPVNPIMEPNPKQDGQPEPVMEPKPVVEPLSGSKPVERPTLCPFEARRLHRSKAHYFEPARHDAPEHEKHMMALDGEGQPTDDGAFYDGYASLFTMDDAEQPGGGDMMDDELTKGHLEEGKASDRLLSKRETDIVIYII